MREEIALLNISSSKIVMLLILAILLNCAVLTRLKFHNPIFSTQNYKLMDAYAKIAKMDNIVSSMYSSDFMAFKLKRPSYTFDAPIHLMIPIDIKPIAPHPIIRYQPLKICRIQKILRISIKTLFTLAETHTIPHIKQSTAMKVWVFPAFRNCSFQGINLKKG